MKRNYCKTKISTIALILLLTASATIVALPATTAQEKTYDFPTFLFVSLSPNPVGVNQIVYVAATFSRPTPTAEGYGGDWYENVTIEVVDPSGHKTVMGPYLTGMVGGVAITYVPSMVGEYTFQAFYPGEVLDLINPSELGGDPLRGWNRHLNGSYLMPAESEIMTLTVQEEPVEPIYQTPSLPDEYWTRPIYATNWDWGELGANWFGIGGSGRYDATGNLQLYGTAPNSPHIMWTKPLSGFFGGQPGAPIPSDQGTQFSSTSGVATYFTPIILNGILYYNQHYGDQFLVDGWEAVDIRTGETLWSKPAGVTGQERLAMGQILRVHNDQEYGSWAYLYSSPVAGVMRVYDAKTCNLVANITDARSESYLMSVEDNTKGSLLGYYTSGGNLIMWNSSKLFSYMAGFTVGGRPIIIGERTHTYGTHNWTEGIEWSVPLPTELNGNPISLSIAARTPEVILLRQVGGPLQNQGVNTLGWMITAGYDAKTGAKLWGPINQTLPPREDVVLVAARDGYYVLHNKDRFQAYGYSLTTGQMLWGPVQLEGNAWSASWRSGDIAYGKVYIWDTGGYVNAINLETGEVEWTFTRGSSGYDTPYGIYPIFGYNAHSIADGKLFLSEGITYTIPLSPSWRLAINCTDGSLVWSILNFDSKVVGAIADGYLVTWNCFDNRLYSFGKGPTETTVSIKNNVVSQGSNVLIEGTIMDISAGSEQEGVIERFPHGLPAVADECMKEWMEYVYMQQIEPDNVEGVKVFLKIQDPNGDWYSATVTTDRNGRFSHMWAPAIVGEYQVTAMFEGSESYYPSQETTTFGVDEETAAAGAPSAEEIAQTTVNQLPEIPAYLTIDLIILIIAAVGVVIGLIAYMALRKQK